MSLLLSLFDSGSEWIFVVVSLILHLLFVKSHKVKLFLSHYNHQCSLCHLLNSTKLTHKIFHRTKTKHFAFTPDCQEEVNDDDDHCRHCSSSWREREMICVTLVVNFYSYHHLSFIPEGDLSTVSDSFLSRGKIFLYPVLQLPALLLSFLASLWTKLITLLILLRQNGNHLQSHKHLLG